VVSAILSAVPAMTSAAEVAEATEKLKGVSSGLREMASDIDGAIASGDRDALRAVLGSDVSALSTALASPVGVERIAVFPVENFGSAMAPIYTTLAL
ncbi:YhgE/Pip domain-containing protein, partial [Adlercreutzia rubneri]|nr:YhgE/Pip domain-containing protein [Adlercreutzia rubneri]